MRIYEAISTLRLIADCYFCLGQTEKGYAFSRAAEAVTKDATLVLMGKTAEIAGIGPSTEKVIKDVLILGRSERCEKLQAELFARYPLGIADGILAISKLSQMTIPFAMLLHDRYGVNEPKDLLAESFQNTIKMEHASVRARIEAAIIAYVREESDTNEPK